MWYVSAMFLGAHGANTIIMDNNHIEAYDHASTYLCTGVVAQVSHFPCHACGSVE